LLEKNEEFAQLMIAADFDLTYTQIAMGILARTTPLQLKIDNIHTINRKLIGYFIILEFQGKYKYKFTNK